MRINGIGTTLLGISKPDEEGTSTATNWFTFLFLPLYPVRRMRVRFLPHKGSGYSYQIVSNEKLVLSEMLKTLLYCWFLIPLFAFAPLIFAFKEVWTALGLPQSLQIAYIIVCVIWVGVVIWKTADRHEARCRPPSLTLRRD